MKKIIIYLFFITNTVAASTTFQYIYDTEGNRVAECREIKGNQSCRYFFYEGVTQVGEYGNSEGARWLLSPSGYALAKVNVTNKITDFLIPDFHDSILATVKASATVQTPKDAFGNALAPSDEADIYMTKQLASGVAGSYNFNLRDYDAFIGRFTTTDPKLPTSSAFSWYSFVNNNPLSYADPTGASTTDETLTLQADARQQQTEREAATQSLPGSVVLARAQLAQPTLDVNTQFSSRETDLLLLMGAAQAYAIANSIIGQAPQAYKNWQAAQALRNRLFSYSTEAAVRIGRRFNPGASALTDSEIARVAIDNTNNLVTNNRNNLFLKAARITLNTTAYATLAFELSTSLDGDQSRPEMKPRLHYRPIRNGFAYQQVLQESYREQFDEALTPSQNIIHYYFN